ncbi:MAG TPA: molybdopterin-synthase adenylyltransferase MoeB [Chloroflexota bacterium]|jgi:adenylyltransferase/sulfurtransferase|nr:molybdopterin-synthase adenylyltransferase MoeB [Chloroflexota bacterium]
MAVAVLVPSALRSLTDNQARVEAQGDTLRQVIEDLERQYPGFGQRLRNADGSIRRFVNVYINGEDVRGKGGLDAALTEGSEVGIMPAMAGGSGFSEEEVVRYSRHLLMPEVGSRGQRKLKQAKVLVIGAGGLGSPAALYLAAAGVGVIGLVDFDDVDVSNLQRQILHHTHDVGRPKVDSARDGLYDINPFVNVVTHQVVMDSSNAREIVDQYDIVVNGCDNFATRYLLSDVAYWAGKPLVDGSILRFDGQATVFEPGKGCYRCLFPTPPPPGEVPSCSEAGVLGMMTGVIGSIQAIETTKLILGIGESMAGKLLVVDALTMDFRMMRTPRDPGCPVCGDHPTIFEPIDYVEFCGAPHAEVAVGAAV